VRFMGFLSQFFETLVSFSAALAKGFAPHR
jgi:hypothetical protein